MRRKPSDNKKVLKNVRSNVQLQLLNYKSPTNVEDLIRSKPVNNHPLFS